MGAVERDLAELRARLDRLEAENRAMREALDQVPTESGGGAISRRTLLGKAAAVAGGLGAGLLIAPRAASATTGTMMYGTTNDSGQDRTTLSAGGGAGTLNLTNTTSTGVVLSVLQEAQGASAPAASIRGPGPGSALELESDSGNTLHITYNGGPTAGRAIYVQKGGVYVQQGGEYGVRIDGGANPLIVSATGDTLQNPTAIFTSSGANGTGPCIEATKNGQGNAITASATLGAAIQGDSEAIGVLGYGPVGVRGAGNAVAGVHGLAYNDHGSAVVAEVTNALNAAPAISASTDGIGPAVSATAGGVGIQATSTGGRGAILSGPVAPLRLMPSTDTTHPTQGTRGDLFVDKGGRLWFCKSRTNWKQLA